jgi:hypothetical protein
MSSDAWKRAGSDANRAKATLTLHAADVAFTKRALATTKSDGAKVAYIGNSAPLEFVSNGPAAAQRTSKTADLLNPLFCAACNKVFAKETVFHAHKGGKKHINALKAMGLFEEADAATAAATVLTSKRDAAAAEAGDAPAAKRPMKAEAVTPPASPPLAPAPAPLPPPAEDEWWKGTVHAKPKAAAGDSEENKGDWLCVSQRCAGVKNARNAPHCKACGALRRLGTQGVRNDMHDSVNDYARRT